MKKKGFTTEQIIGKLREAEILLGQGSTVGEVSRKVSVTEQTCAAFSQIFDGFAEILTGSYSIPFSSKQVSSKDVILPLWRNFSCQASYLTYNSVFLILMPTKPGSHHFCFFVGNEFMMQKGIHPEI